MAAVIIVLLTTGASKRKQNEPESSQIEIETTEPVPVVEENRFNFVMFGIDDVGYTPDDINRSDMIMVVSIDTEAKKINLISILRDSRAPIEGLEPQKINKAYQEGGASLALKTINNAFHTNFDKYLTLNWQDVVFLVDDIDGIDVEITEEEADVLNGMVHSSDISQEGRNAYSEDVWGGLVHLDGTQAMHFSRIRKIDSDYDRANRQQNVMNAVLHKIRTMGTSQALGMLDTFMETVETSYFYSDFYDILSPLDMPNMTLYRYVVPNEEVNPELVGGLDEEGSWVWQFDIEKTADFINQQLSWE